MQKISLLVVSDVLEPAVYDWYVFIPYVNIH